MIPTSPAARNSLLAALAALAALGCGASDAPRKVIGADGTSWWVIACNNDMGRCLEKAKERCPGGYEVQGEREARAAEDARGASGAAIPMTHTRMAPSFPGELYVRCREP